MTSDGDQQVFRSPWVCRACALICVATAYVVGVDAVDRPGPIAFAEGVLVLVCLLFAVRAARAGIVMGTQDVIVRNWLHTRRVPRAHVASAGMEMRWYLRGGWLTVLRTQDGKRVACIGLSGTGRRTENKVDEVASLLGVPRVDRP